MYVADMTLDELYAEERRLQNYLDNHNLSNSLTEQAEFDLDDVRDRIAQLDTSAGLL